MKTKILLPLLLVLGMCGGRAAIHPEVFSNVNTAIPDGNPVGVYFDGVVNDIPAGATVNGMQVGLTVTGGYNGDLYAYLVAPNGVRVTLLDRPGVTESDPFGYGGSGLSIKLYDIAAADIQATSETPGVQFAGDYRPADSLADINGSLANGTWTLYFADMSNGGGQATLNGWRLDLDVSAVPEPANVAMAIFGGILAAAGVLRQLRATGIWNELQGSSRGSLRLVAKAGHVSPSDRSSGSQHP